MSSMYKNPNKIAAALGPKVMSPWKSPTVMKFIHDNRILTAEQLAGRLKSLREFADFRPPTRNAVLGAIHRWNRTCPIGATITLTRRPGSRKLYTAKRSAKSSQKPSRYTFNPNFNITLVPVPDPMDGNFSIHPDHRKYVVHSDPNKVVSDTGCRWPYGDGPFHFCCFDAHHRGQPYCLSHTQIAFRAKY